MPINRIHTTDDGRRIYKITDVSGKRHTLRSRKNETLRQFRARCDELDLITQSPHLGTVDITMTLNELFVEWVESYQSTYTSPADQRVLSGIYKNHIEPDFGHKKIASIRRADIYKHLTELVKRGYSESLVNKARQCFSRPYNWAINDLALDISDPTQGLTIQYRHGVEAKGVRHMTDEELARFFQASEASKYHNYFRVLALTGMRPSEALGLKREDITLSGINIERKMSVDGLGPLKTKAAYRSIPMTDELMNIANEQISGSESWLFPTKGGLPSMEAVKSAFSRVLRSTRQKRGFLIISPLDFTLYDFRHTFGTRAADSGMPLKTLQYIMGHADIRTTMRYYVAVTDNAKKEAASIMDCLFGPNLDPIDRQTHAECKDSGT